MKTSIDPPLGPVAIFPPSERVLRFPSLEFFRYDHLPPHLQAVALPFYNLAQDVARTWFDQGVPGERCAQMLGREDQTSLALQKLLEAKDAAVRAALPLK
jgi:hypothetical protein